MGLHPRSLPRTWPACCRLFPAQSPSRRRCASRCRPSRPEPDTNGAAARTPGTPAAYRYSHCERPALPQFGLGETASRRQSPTRPGRCRQQPGPAAGISVLTLHNYRGGELQDGSHHFTPACPVGGKFRRRFSRRSGFWRRQRMLPHNIRISKMPMGRQRFFSDQTVAGVDFRPARHPEP